MNYHNITYPDMNNGDGLRVVLWVSGCSHHCKGCQNPQTWDDESGVSFDENARKELFEDLDHDYISGLTLSGGDPLYECNLGEVLSLVKEFRERFPSKTIWLYTGYTWDEIKNEYFDALNNTLRRCILEFCDVLIDGEYIEELRDVTLKWRGSKNQRVIDLPKTLESGKVVLYCD